jgi:hypothetical protein
MSVQSLSAAEGVTLMFLVMSFVLVGVVRILQRRRPGLDIMTPVAVAVVVRILAVIAINATGKAAQLRGGDETTFLDYAHTLAATSWGHGWFPHGIYQLQTVIFAAQLKALSLTPTAMRMTQIGIAVLGLVLIIVSVYELAGPRAARFLAWILAFEPSNVFFNSEIHKEPVMVLASGLVVFGGTKLWKRFDLKGGVWPCVLGSVIAIETRAYAGWFLVIAAVFILLHSALKRLDRPLLALPIVYTVLGAALLLTPTLLHITSKGNLAKLQADQSYTTQTQASANSGGANGDNLALEDVNFSTRGAVLSNLPVRMLDLITRPYPWQISDISQQLGAFSTLLAYGGIVLLLRYAWRVKRRAFGLIVPLLYPMFFLLAAYSLSAGNAGTGFRYRSHIVILLAAMLAVVRSHVLEAEEESSPVEEGEFVDDLGPHRILQPA